MRLLTETYRAFVMRGANLSEEKQQRLREINQELDLLSLQFGRNVVAETNDYKYFVTDENDLRGLPQSAKQAAKEEAINAGRPDAWLFLAKRTSFTPVLQYCENRNLRRELLLAYTTRCNHGGEHDNKPLIQRTMALRVEKAQLFGFETPADYILQDAMAHNAKNAYDLLLQVWQPSLEAAKKEADIRIVTKNGVRYSVPSTIHMEQMADKLTVRFRVGDVYKDKALCVYLGEDQVSRTPKRVMAPGEMEQVILLKSKLLEIAGGSIDEKHNTLTIPIEEK